MSEGRDEGELWGRSDSDSELRARVAQLTTARPRMRQLRCMDTAVRSKRTHRGQRGNSDAAHAAPLSRRCFRPPREATCVGTTSTALSAHTRDDGTATGASPVQRPTDQRGCAAVHKMSARATRGGRGGAEPRPLQPSPCLLLLPLSRCMLIALLHRLSTGREWAVQSPTGQPDSEPLAGPPRDPLR